MVVGYARSTPHDQYFYDKPREMIAGEVPVPALTGRNLSQAGILAARSGLSVRVEGKRHDAHVIRDYSPRVYSPRDHSPWPNRPQRACGIGHECP